VASSIQSKTIDVASSIQSKTIELAVQFGS